MEKESFDYSKVPHNFGLCATADCPHADLAYAGLHTLIRRQVLLFRLR